ncbi:FecR family protein [Lunatibacter salilacus]|uniref:FecR family protein n=1 Tax=Lunatibacter salilacus TaxID=2483804 RepID=UPI00131E360E|nr:FecR family protein [Lunatibacter salilacus]
MENTAFQQLLKKYRLGECTETESQFVEEWYSNLDKEDVVKVQDINSLERKLWANISDKIDQKEFENKTGDDARKWIIHRSVIRKLAAIILIGLAFLGLQLNQIYRQATPEEKVINPEFSTVFLSDGSIVKLKGDSQLEYPNKFMGNTREVNLVGEAFFDIAKDSIKPFIIHSPNITTKVLGTSFSIKAYKGHNSQEVEVVTGKVLVSVRQLSGISKDIILIPSQKIIYNQKLDSLIAINTIDSTPITQVTPPNLVFIEVPLQQIVTTLSDLYDKQIILKNSGMNNCLITADLTEEPLEICLEILAKSINATYTINNQNIEINGSGCNP